MLSSLPHSLGLIGKVGLLLSHGMYLYNTVPGVRSFINIEFLSLKGLIRQPFGFAGASALSLGGAPPKIVGSACSGISTTQEITDDIIINAYYNSGKQ